MAILLQSTRRFLGVTIFDAVDASAGNIPHQNLLDPG